MKDILLSVRPKWCEKICHEIGKDKNGKPIYEKVIEARKSAPKEVPFKCYIYCTKGKDGYEWLYRVDNNGYGKAQSWHGKVIGEFICDEVDEYTFSHYEAEYRVTHDEQKAMCLNQPELIRYGQGKTLYGWHISDLKIYDKPRELSEFFKPCPNEDKTLCLYCDKSEFTPDMVLRCGNAIKRPPQSWCYVEEEKMREADITVEYLTKKL